MSFCRSLLIRLLSNRPATPARGLGDFLTVLTKRRLAARLGSGFCFLACLVPAFASRPLPGALAFEENQGQARADVRYLAHTPAGTLLLTSQKAIFRSSSKAGGVAVTLKFGRSSARTRVTGAELLSTKVNYFLGRPETWRSNIATYRKVRYAGLYPGIDAVFYTGPSAGAPLEFDVIAAPHAKPQDVRLILTAVKSASVRILPTGDLTISTGGTTMLFRKPSAWQEDAFGGKQSVEAPRNSKWRTDGLGHGGNYCVREFGAGRHASPA